MCVKLLAHFPLAFARLRKSKQIAPIVQGSKTVFVHIVAINFIIQFKVQIQNLRSFDRKEMILQALNLADVVAKQVPSSCYHALIMNRF